MTIALSIKVGEGLVYATDSTSSFFDNSGATSTLLQSFHHARKLIQLADYPIGIMTFGLGSIGARNLESLVTEFENRLTPLSLLNGGPYSVETIANELRAFIAGKYTAVFPPPQPGEPDTRPDMGVIVGGYSRNEFFPDEFLLAFPADTATRTRPPAEGGFGVLWWGVITPIIRLILGFDPGVRQWLIDKGVDPAEAEGVATELRDKFRWTILFDGMPLQDAIDFGVYLADVTIGHSRFVVGPPVCGGHVDVATISHRGFSWVRQKKHQVKGDSVFF